jgi:hypothetical protein
MILRGYSGAGGKLIHEKKPEAKNLVTLSLNREKKELERGRKGVHSTFSLGKRGGGGLELIAWKGPWVFSNLFKPA